MRYSAPALVALLLFGRLVYSTEAAPPKDQEVCFAPDEPCDAKLISFISSATQSIDIAIYDINLDQLVHQLLVQRNKVKVRVVVDQRQSKGSHSLVSTLVKAGISVKYGHQRGIMHNKFTIVDGRMVETGSFNYTNHATKANQENQIYLSAPVVVSRYKEKFDKIWDTGKAVPAEPNQLSLKKRQPRAPSGE